MGAQHPTMAAYNMYGGAVQPGMQPISYQHSGIPMEQNFNMGNTAHPRTPMSVSRDIDQQSQGPARSVASARSR